LLVKFPLFHIAPIEQASTRQVAPLNPKAFAEQYWTTRLVPRLADAHDAATVLAALRANAQQARSEFGRTVGLGRSTYFLLRGEGTIVSIEKNAIGVALAEAGREPDLLITTGPVFGNAVRDAPGAITAGEFSRSQDFNDLAAELNLLVENRVERPLAEHAHIGGHVRFVGCVELLGEKPIKPLKLIPLEAVVD
jgi:predicted lipoprotein